MCKNILIIFDKILFGRQIKQIV